MSALDKLDRNEVRKPAPLRRAQGHRRGQGVRTGRISRHIRGLSDKALQGRDAGVCETRQRRVRYLKRPKRFREFALENMMIWTVISYAEATAGASPIS